MSRWNDPGPVRPDTQKLLDYFRILNSGDEPRWERAFTDTWHPETRVDGRTFDQLRDAHRARLGNAPAENIHLVGRAAPHLIEYSTEVRGRYEGPFIATFRDGRVYRVI